jgi:tRNA(Ile)-lysidine synthase
MDPFLRTVDRALEELGVDRVRSVLVACSGGPDSMALGHVAMALARAGRLGPLVLCHVDHQLRADSGADAALVARAAAEGGADFLSAVVEVPRSGRSLEAAAREVRYRALDQVARERGDAIVLTGHTRSDQAETVLMRMATGTGLEGLAGVRPVRGRFVRPLLGVSREETSAYCERHRLAVVSDPMNLDRRFLRAEVRHSWLPLMARANPRIEEALAHLAERARELAPVLDAAGRDLLLAARSEDGSFDAAALAQAPAAVRARVLSLAARRAGGRPLGERHHTALAGLLRLSGSASLDLPGLRAHLEYGRLRLVRPGARPAAEPPGLAVSGPDGPYAVRTWRLGDRMRPARLRGRSRKLSDLFIDARVPRTVRAAARVVVRESDGAVEWAEHIGPAFGARAVVTLTPALPLATNKNR